MIPVLATSGDPVSRDFAIFGQYWLTDCISCTVTEERNGLYDCQIVYPINGANYDQIENGTIVLCPHDNTLDRQPFVVYRRELNLDGTATLYLHHISYALNYIVTDSFPNGTTDALSSIFAGITATAAPYVNGFSASLPDDIGLYQFSADDDTERVLGFAMAHTFARSVRDLLIGSKESILSILEHGEFEWDRYNVIFHNGPNGRGNDNGVAIRYGGTLTEARQTDDTESAYSGVVPYWIDPSTNKVVKLSTQGGRTVSVDEEAPEDGYFPGRYNRRLVPLDASQVFDSEPTPTQLRQYAEEYLGNLQPWQQYSNITINFVTQDTDSTDDYAELQGVRLCDTIHVSVAPFQAEYTAKIIKTVYNVLLERYDSVEIGQPQVTLSDIYGGTGGGAASSKSSTDISIETLLELVQDASNSASAASSSATSASGSASSASTSASAAEASATAAAASASDAADSATAASTSASNADSYATQASNQAANASSSASTANTWRQQAQAAATAAATSEDNASTFADRASTSADEAASSARSAQSYMQGARTYSEQAGTSASNASTSATEAGRHRSAAQTSADNAAASATAAATSESNASTSATSASSSATAASGSAASAQYYAEQAAQSAADAAAAAGFDPTQYYTKTETNDLLDDKVSTYSDASLRGLTTSSATSLGNGAVDITATLLPAQSTTSVRGSLNVAGGITSVGGGTLCTSSQRALGIQCGEYSATASVAKASTKEYEITFPVAFATGCVPIVVVSMMANSASAASLGNTVPYVMGTSRSETGFTVKFFNNSTIAHTPRFTWVAIGEMEG